MALTRSRLSEPSTPCLMYSGRLSRPTIRGAPLCSNLNPNQTLTAVQSEYSLWARDPEAEVLPTCEELGIGFVPWSPLGQGFLKGKVYAVMAFDTRDIRSVFPRFTSDARKGRGVLVAWSRHGDLLSPSLVWTFFHSIGRCPEGAGSLSAFSFLLSM